MDNDVIDDIGSVYPTAYTWIRFAINFNDSIVDVVIGNGMPVDGDRTLVDGRIDNEHLIGSFSHTYLRHPASSVDAVNVASKPMVWKQRER
jgi:hypothetical protein